MRPRTIVRHVPLAGAMLLLTGCLAGPWAQPEMPPELGPVIDKPSEFLVSAAPDGGGSPPGSPGDDLEDGLTGCWGAFWPAGYEGVPVTIYMVFQFDTAAGTFSQIALQVTPLAPVLPGVLSVYEGTFQVESGTHDVRLTLITTATWLNDARSGELVQESSPTNEQPWVREVFVTLRQEELHVWEISSGEPPDDGGWWVYRRFECPD